MVGTCLQDFLSFEQSPIIHNGLTCGLYFTDSDVALLFAEGNIFPGEGFLLINHTFIKTIPIGVEERKSNYLSGRIKPWLH